MKNLYGHNIYRLWFFIKNIALCAIFDFILLPMMISHTPQKPEAIFQTAQFVGSYPQARLIPDSAAIEITLCGRSNVGKSSLINAVCGRKGLAKTSNTPGRTQSLIIYDISSLIRLVDMPGYGYAKVAKTDRAAWAQMIGDYLKNRAHLRLAILCVDARHGLKDSDLEMIENLAKVALPVQIVLTKSDKIKKSELTTVIQTTRSAVMAYPGVQPEPLPVSSETKSGIDELRQILLKTAGHNLN